MTERDRRLFEVVNTVVCRHVYSLPVDIEKLCRIYGAYLLSYGQCLAKSGLTAEELQAMTGSRDGVTLDYAGSWTILYNEKASETRLRFTLAEELMHRLVGHSQDEDFRMRRQSYAPETYALYEAEAKRAACMLLVPPTVYYRYRRLYSLEQLSELFRVSEACMYTAAKDYEANEKELRAAFTARHIVCDTRGLARKNPLRPRGVAGEGL